MNILLSPILITISLILLSLPPLTVSYDSTTFLGAFGYLDIDVGDGESDAAALVYVPPDNRTRAIKSFQQYYGLPVTGVLDDKTKKAMKDPRCGVPDKLNSEEEPASNSGRKKRYATSAMKWPKTRLTYRFINYTSDIPQQLTRQSFKEAFKLWEDSSALEFIEETKRYAKADIEIAYMHGLHGDRSPFSTQVLGHAFFPTAGFLHMNDLHSWSYGSAFGTDTTYVAVHELGHILGLKHSSLNTVMHASYPGYRRNVQLSQDDVRGVQALYGRNPCSPRNPCLNNGSCKKRSGGLFGCNCQRGYTGRLCERIIDKQTPRRCRAMRVSNGHIYPFGTLSPNQVARLYCKQGFELIGPSEFTCTHRGYYSPSQNTAACRRKVFCPSLTVSHGTTYPRSRPSPGTVISFRCDDDYEISGAQRIKCRSDGSYDRSPPQCVKIRDSPEDIEPDFCPQTFDAVVARTQKDTLRFAFKGSRYWIFKKLTSENGAPKSHWTHSNLMNAGYKNIPHNLDAAFSLSNRTTNKRYICFVKWPKVYFFNIISSEIEKVEDFPSTFGVRKSITAAVRWDDDTVYFFVPNGYYIYDIKAGRLKPSYLQPMTTFLGMRASTTVTSAAKAFYNGLMYLFIDKEVHLIRQSDKQVVRVSHFSRVWHRNIKLC